jgi:hypothetical protein
MNWSVNKLEVITYEGLLNVVISVNWSVSDTQQNITETFNGVTLVDPPGDNFTPYNELTEVQVLEWVYKKVSKTGTEAIITQRIQDKISPAVDPPLPWNKT